MNIHFKILYSTYYPKVYANCMLILKDPFLAEEAAQDAFIKAYEKLETLKDPNKFGAWVATIAVNNSKNLYNKGKRSFPIENSEVKFFLEKNVLIEYEPLEKIEEGELKNEINEAIDKLNPTLKQLIILKYYWELPDAKIAKMMDMPIGTVKSSLYRAKKSLKKILPTINKDYLYFVQEGEK